MRTLTKEQYMEQLHEDASRLANYARQTADEKPDYTPRDACLEDVQDVLDGHDWFSKKVFGPSAHGCIIECADDANVDPSLYSDWLSLAESDEPSTVLKRIAYAMYEAHVIEQARQQL